MLSAGLIPCRYLDNKDNKAAQGVTPISCSQYLEKSDNLCLRVDS